MLRGGLTFFSDDEAPNQELIDFQATDSGATDRQATHRERADCDSTDRNCAQRKTAHRKGASCQRTHGSCAGARTSQFATERLHGLHSLWVWLEWMKRVQHLEVKDIPDS